MTKTRTYKSWQSMKDRCLNPKATRYSEYGAKGITVCDRWLVFENFLADMGERPAGKTLDRKDNKKGYEPANCRWATYAQQTRNTSWVKLSEETAKAIRQKQPRGRALKVMARQLGVSDGTIHAVLAGRSWRDHS